MTIIERNARSDWPQLLTILAVAGFTTHCAGSQPNQPAQGTKPVVPVTAMRTNAPKAATDPEAPVPGLSATSLAAQQSHFKRYPPTACRLKALLGKEFDLLADRRGQYHAAKQPEQGGYFEHGRNCPQSYCDGALIWIHPTGKMAVAVQVEKQTRVFVNRLSQRSQLPATMKDFIAARPPAIWTIKDTAFEGCDTPAEKHKLQRYVAARAGQACDPDYSSFDSPMLVKPAAGKVHGWWYTEPKAGTKQRTQVAVGDLVMADYVNAKTHQRIYGKSRKWQPDFVCAQMQLPSGSRTVGWLARKDLVALESYRLHRGSTKQDYENWRDLASGLPVRPQWFVQGQSHSGDSFKLLRDSSAVLHLHISTFQNGHMCELAERFQRSGRFAIFSPPSPQRCGAVALRLNNAIVVQDNGACGGARAHCNRVFYPSAALTAP